MADGISKTSSAEEAKPEGDETPVPDQTDPEGDDPTTEAEKGTDETKDKPKTTLAEGEKTPVDPAATAAKEGDKTQDKSKTTLAEGKKIPADPAANAATDAAKEKQKENIKASDKQNALGEEKPKEKGVCVSPTPSGEELPEGEVDTIIQQSMDILQLCQKKLDEEKLDSHSLTFMLLRIKESMDSYSQNYIPSLNTFLVLADGITADYYARMCCALPRYGDYGRTIERSGNDNEKIDAGGDQQVSKKRLLGVIKNVTDNYYASAMIMKSLRGVLKDVNSTISYDRRDIMNKLYTPFPDWMGIQDNVTCQLDSIRDHVFKISSYLDFLKLGEAKAGPALDYTQLATDGKKKKKDQPEPSIIESDDESNVDT